MFAQGATSDSRYLESQSIEDPTPLRNLTSISSISMKHSMPTNTSYISTVHYVGFISPSILMVKRKITLLKPPINFSLSPSVGAIPSGSYNQTTNVPLVLGGTIP